VGQPQFNQLQCSGGDQQHRSDGNPQGSGRDQHGGSGGNPEGSGRSQPPPHSGRPVSFPTNTPTRAGSSAATSGIMGTPGSGSQDSGGSGGQGSNASSSRENFAQALSGKRVRKRKSNTFEVEGLTPEEVDAMEEEA
jgi:hypothetical protein